LIARAEVIGLTRYRAKAEPGESLSEMKLVEGLGIEGDFHQGGTKQISLLSAETRRWIEAQTEKGLCFARFRENILVAGLPDDLETGALLSVGDAVLRITAKGKQCYGDCPFFSFSNLSFSNNGTPCRLSGRTMFAAVEQGGIIRVGDAVSLVGGEMFMRH
jgi:cyclic pyranopterin phosphate synthase